MDGVAASLLSQRLGLSETSKPSERAYNIYLATLDAMLHAIFAAFAHTEG